MVLRAPQSVAGISNFPPCVSCFSVFSALFPNLYCTYCTKWRPLRLPSNAQGQREGFAGKKEYRYTQKTLVAVLPLFRGTLRKGMFSLLLEISRRGGGGELALRGAKAGERERGFSAPRGGREGAEAEAEGGSLPLPSPSPTYTPARLLALLPPPPDSHCVAPNRVSKRLPPASPACCNAPPSLCRMSGGIMLQEEGGEEKLSFFWAN